MKKLCLIFIIVLSFNLYGADFILTPPQEINLGEVIQTKLEIKGKPDISKLPNLSGVTVEDSLYIVQMGSILKQEDKLTIDVSVIITKKIDKEVLQGQKNNFSFNILFKGQHRFNETKPEKESILVDSKLEYASKRSIIIIVVVISIVLICAVLLYFFKRQNKKKTNNLKELKELMYQAIEYDDIVRVWYKRNLILKAFPQIVEKYKVFEKILNTYQFAPSVSDISKDKIIRAYQDFLAEIKGDLDGV